MENKKKFLEVVERNNRRYEEFKDMNVEYFALNYKFYSGSKLNKNVIDSMISFYQINTVEDLLSLSNEKIISYLVEFFYPYDEYAYKMRDAFIDNIHRFGFVLKNEYRSIKLDDNVSSIRLDMIDNFPFRPLNMLKRNNIFCLGQLLSISFNDLKKIRNLGEASIIELRNFINSIGYSFKGECKYLDEEIVEKRKEKIELLEDVFDNKSLCNLLYRNGIFTVEDLTNSSDKLCNIRNFGEGKKRELYELMTKNNIEFKEVERSYVITMTTDLTKIEGFPNTSLFKLKRGHINTLGELLKIDYRELSNIKGMGELSMIELREFIHSIGYSFENEFYFLSEKLDQMRKDGVVLLESVIGKCSMCSTLYNNGIYTVEDLIFNKDKVFAINKFGNVKRTMLLKIMDSVGLYFVDDINIEADFDTIKSDLSNSADEDKKLIFEYEKLLEEKAKLLEKEKELDMLIGNKMMEIRNRVYVMEKVNNISK